MVGTVELLFSVAIAVGWGCCWLGYLCVRRWNEPGSTAFGVFLVLWGGMPSATVAMGTLGDGPSAVAQIFLWCLATLSWFLFTLQYTGSYTRLGKTTVVVLAAPSLVVIPWLWGMPGSAEITLLEVAATLAITYYSGLALIGAVLLLRITRNYGHLSAREGICFAVVGVVPSVTTTASGMLFGDGGLTMLAVGIFTGGFLVVFVASALSLYRFRLFDSTLAAGTLGERAIARESEDLILIVDDSQQLLKLNDAATETLSVQRRDVLGSPLEAVLARGIETFTEEDVIELQTERGLRKFDSQVTALTDQHGDRLGWMVTLRDITTHELRRQRLEVLNRIIRHNLRNQVSVIEANTEVVADTVESPELESHLETVTDSATTMATLGEKAKSVEELLGRERTGEEVALEELTTSVVTDLKERWPTATVSTTRGPDVTVRGDRDASELLVENLVDVLVEHSTVERPNVQLSLAFDADEEHPVTLTAACDGAAIPQRELEVIIDGTETPLKHGTGVSLWVANWVVTDLGGDLTVHRRDEGGTRIEVGLPYQQLESPQQH